MIQIANLLRALPINLCVVGRKRDYMLRMADVVFRSRSRSELNTEFGAFAIDRSHEPERVFCLFFYNLLRYYDRSDLGQHIRRIAVPESTFLDIGANLGLYALLARRAGMSTVVVEPEPAHAAFLRRNEAIYGKVLSVAVSDAPGDLPLYYDPTNPAGTSLCNALDYKVGAGSIPVRTFSALARAGDFGPLNKISLIKIDVEGFEVEAVEGMAEALADPDFRPDIWCEVRGDTAGRAPGSYRKVRQQLEHHGYATKWICDGRRRPLNEGDLSREVVYDLLFTRGGTAT